MLPMLASSLTFSLLTLCFFPGIGVIPSSLIPPSVRTAVNVLSESTQHKLAKRSGNLIKNCLVKTAGAKGAAVVSNSNQPPVSTPAWDDDANADTVYDKVTQTIEEVMEIKRQLARPDIHMTKVGHIKWSVSQL